MDVYAARQPIFDRGMNTFGYELLYRRSLNNFYEGNDDNQATADLINNAFLTLKFSELTDGTRAFINFSEELLEKEIPLLLPKDKIVVEILERVEPTAAVIIACKMLKSKGYILALDDFVFHDRYRKLIELADIIKIEFPIVPYEEQRQLIGMYKDRIKFLAEKIETREEHKLAMNMGYEYFQGYFYSKPIIVRGREIEGLNINLMRVINELNQEEPEYQRITEIIEKDLGLSYKLLRLSNSAVFDTRYKIYSIKQALVRLGTEEMKKWVYLIMFKEVQNLDNKELIKLSLVRGKLMELLSIEMGMKIKHLEFFITGMFSSIDVLLNQSMEEIVEELPLTINVTRALLGKNNEIRQTLDNIIRFEKGDWDSRENKDFLGKVGKEKYMELYIKALKWVMELDY